jgi:hypothetical protein
VPGECVDEYLRIVVPHLVSHCYSVASTDYVAWRETVEKGALLALPLKRADGGNRQWRLIGLKPPPFQQTLKTYSQSYDRENTENSREDASGNIGLALLAGRSQKPLAREPIPSPSLAESANH